MGRGGRNCHDRRAGRRMTRCRRSPRRSACRRRARNRCPDACANSRGSGGRAEAVAGGDRGRDRPPAGRRSLGRRPRPRTVPSLSSGPAAPRLAVALEAGIEERHRPRPRRSRRGDSTIDVEPVVANRARGPELGGEGADIARPRWPVRRPRAPSGTGSRRPAADAQRRGVDRDRDRGSRASAPRARSTARLRSKRARKRSCRAGGRASGSGGGRGSGPRSCPARISPSGIDLADHRGNLGGLAGGDAGPLEHSGEAVAASERGAKVEIGRSGLSGSGSTASVGAMRRPLSAP